MIDMNLWISNISGELLNPSSWICQCSFCHSLTFVFSPPSNTYGYQSIELIPNGSHTVGMISFVKN